MAASRIHTDGLLPADGALRSIARRLYEGVRELPLISPHGHVAAEALLRDEQFPDPAQLFVTPDHYVTRLLHARGVPLGDLGVGRGALTDAEARGVWRLLCTHWSTFSGTSVRYWLEHELSEIFGIDERPSEASAERIYDAVSDCLVRPGWRPRALFERFKIAFLATTDDPADDLAAHAALAADPTWHGTVVPTFRPDRYLEPSSPAFGPDVTRLGVVAGVDTGTWRGWVEAMERRREHFRRHGARSTDHSHAEVLTVELSPAQVERLYAAAMRGDIAPADAGALQGHMLLEMARMSAEDGLTMMLHPGVLRGHHRPTLERFGPDTGHDLPMPGSFTTALRPMLERFGTHPGFRVVLFTLDESVLAREIAPLAGFYPSVYVGAPWWFFDAPDAVQRWRSAVTETAGFLKTSGFIDDTRAFCSIPARHDMSRRLDAGFLARFVAEHRLDEDEAHAILLDLVVGRPTEVFSL